jgi:hypothetical protein
MHHRDKYKNFAESHKTGQDWPFWKVILAGWLIRSPLKVLRFFVKVSFGLGFFLLVFILEIFPEDTQKNFGGQNTHHRSY